MESAEIYHHLTGCVTSGGLLPLSEPPVSNLRSGHQNRRTSQGCGEKCNYEGTQLAHGQLSIMAVLFPVRGKGEPSSEPPSTKPPTSPPAVNTARRAPLTSDGPRCESETKPRQRAINIQHFSSDLGSSLSRPASWLHLPGEPQRKPPRLSGRT